LALGADERRDKLRKAAGRGKYPLIRRCLNGGTHAGTPCVPMRQHITHGGEPGELKHLSNRRKSKKHRCPEERRAKWEEPKPRRGRRGVRTAQLTVSLSRTALGKPAREGESPVSGKAGGSAVSRVRRDTRNPGGTSGDHPVRRNTLSDR